MSDSTDYKFNPMCDWKQVTETIIISRDDISKIRIPYKLKKQPLNNRVKNLWFSFRWELSNFILERD